MSLKGKTIAIDGRTYRVHGQAFRPPSYAGQGTGRHVAEPAGFTLLVEDAATGELSQRDAGNGQIVVTGPRAYRDELERSSAGNVRIYSRPSMGDLDTAAKFADDLGAAIRGAGVSAADLARTKLPGISFRDLVPTAWAAAARQGKAVENATVGVDPAAPGGDTSIVVLGGQRFVLEATAAASAAKAVKAAREAALDEARREVLEAIAEHELKGDPADDIGCNVTWAIGRAARRAEEQNRAAIDTALARARAELPLKEPADTIGPAVAELVEMAIALRDERNRAAGTAAELAEAREDLNSLRDAANNMRELSQSRDRMRAERDEARNEIAAKARELDAARAERDRLTADVNAARIERDKLRDRVNAAEALYGFVGWLTARRVTVTMGASADATVAVELVRRFVEANDFDLPREGWHRRLAEMHERDADQPREGQPDGTEIEALRAELERVKNENARLQERRYMVKLPLPVRPTGITREWATWVATRAAEVHRPSYYAEPFTPHEWVVDAVLSAAESVHEGMTAMRNTRRVRVILDGPPGPEAGRFVELEDDAGKSIGLGSWIELAPRNPDAPSLWALEIPIAETAQVASYRDDFEKMHQRMEAARAELEDARAQAAAAKRDADAWNETAKRYAINEQFWRELVTKIAEPFGDRAKTADDGTVMQDVVALRVPELVAELAAEVVIWRDDSHRLQRLMTVVTRVPAELPEHAPGVTEDEQGRLVSSTAVHVSCSDRTCVFKPAALRFQAERNLARREIIDLMTRIEAYKKAAAAGTGTQRAARHDSLEPITAAPVRVLAPDLQPAAITTAPPPAVAELDGGMIRVTQPASATVADVKPAKLHGDG